MTIYSKISSMINENSPWGGNGNNGPKNNAPKDDELDKLIKNSSDKIKNLFEKPKNNDGDNDKFPKIFLIILIIFATLWLASGFYVVKEGERAVVLRFGQYNRIAMPGPNYYLPTPFEKITKLKVDKIQKEEMGQQNFESSNASSIRKYYRNSGKQVQPNKNHSILMLTGDENIVDINFFVQWRISNIKDFAFNVDNPRDTLRNVSESAMREIIGETPVAEAHTGGKTIIQSRVKELAQKILDQYKTGVEIIHLQLLKVDPPAEVIDAYRDVQTARADKERSINEAISYQNDIIPRARGNSSKIIQDAEGYKQALVTEAEGSAAKFNAIYKEYKSSKNVTRKRIYLETMEHILSDMDKIIIENKSGVLPYLPIEEFKNNKKVQ